MNGSGCKTCPVEKCETLEYRGSTCAAQRAKFGLGDPMTNADCIRTMSDKELAVLIYNIYDDEEDCAKIIETTRIYAYTLQDIEEWLKQPVDMED